MSIDNVTGADDAAALEQLTNVTSMMWDTALEHPEQYEETGLHVTHDGERAAFTKEFSPTRFTRVSFAQRAGVWSIRTEVQKPTMEDVGLGRVERTTTERALAIGELGMRTTVVGWPNKDGTLAGEEVTSARIVEPMEGAQIGHVFNILREIRGEDPHMTPKAPKRWRFGRRHPR